MRVRCSFARVMALSLILALVASAVPASARLLPRGEAAMRSLLADGAREDEDLRDVSRWRASLLPLYERRSFAPLWFADARVTSAGAALIRELGSVERRGLDVRDYAGARIARLVIDARSGDEARLMRLDLLMSLNALRLATDLHAGRVDPKALGLDLDVPHLRLDAAQTLEALASSQDLSRSLDELEPDLRHYDLLKKALARYRELARRDGLTDLPSFTSRSIRQGQIYEGAPRLRALLRVLGDLAMRDESSAAGLILDDALVAGLRHFQRRHGLEEDGVLGRRTFKALTTPLGQRVRQIELSLERARWLPPKLETPPIIVNIPQFKLFAFKTTEDAASEILQMDVVVGSSFAGRQTPIFAADLRYIVLKPYWDVPRSILIGEYLDRIRSDPGWVDRNGFEIVRGQGDDAEPVRPTPATVEQLAAGALRLRQKPGPDNALGSIKFMLPNRHNVYLHDTPAQTLFAQARRAFSHGCIRVAQPMALLEHVLRGRSDWTVDRARAAIEAGGGPQRIQLGEPVRVFIVYGTALATEAGDTLFFDDIYGHDARLGALLDARHRSAAAGRST